MLLLLGQRGCRITGELPKLGFELAQSSVAKYIVERSSKSGMADLCANHAPNIAVGFRYTQANPRTGRVTNRARKLLPQRRIRPNSLIGALWF